MMYTRKMKQAYIDKAKADYKFLCYTINGSSEKYRKKVQLLANTQESY